MNDITEDILWSQACEEWVEGFTPEEIVEMVKDGFPGVVDIVEAIQERIRIEKDEEKREDADMWRAK